VLTNKDKSFPSHMASVAALISESSTLARQKLELQGHGHVVTIYLPAYQIIVLCNNGRWVRIDPLISVSALSNQYAVEP